MEVNVCKSSVMQTALIRKKTEIHVDNTSLI